MGSESERLAAGLVGLSCGARTLWRMKWLSLATAMIVGVVVLSGCGSQKPACVTAPSRSFPLDRLLTNTTTHLTVPVDAIVWVALGEGAIYTNGHGFPWVTPRTSDSAVLAPVRVCKETLVTSLPEQITGFKALRRGTATLTARLARGWPGSFKIQPAVDTVTVK